MSNVFIKTMTKNKKKQYVVIEQLFDVELKTFTAYNDAKAYAKFVNGGGGFAGYTPLFILEKRDNIP